MEEEAEKIRQIQSEVDKQMSIGSPPGAAGATSPLNMSIEEKMEVDARSIYVGNVSVFHIPVFLIFFIFGHASALNISQVIKGLLYHITHDTCNSVVYMNMMKSRRHI